MTTIRLVDAIVAKEADRRGFDRTVGNIILDATEKFIDEIKAIMDFAGRV